MLGPVVQRAGYKASLITVEVVSRGLPNAHGFMTLKSELKAQLSDLMVKAARQAIIGSFKVAGTVLNMQIIHCLWSPQLCAYTHACVHSLPCRLAGLNRSEYNYMQLTMYFTYFTSLSQTFDF